MRPTRRLSATPTANDRRVFVGVDQGTTHLGGSADRRRSAVTRIFATDVYGTARAERRSAPIWTTRSSALSTGTPSRPVVRLIGAANESDYQHLAVAVQLVNAALPEGSKITIGEALPGVSLRSTVNAQGRWFPSGAERDGTIHVEFVPGGAVPQQRRSDHLERRRRGDQHHRQLVHPVQ